MSKLPLFIIDDTADLSIQDILKNKTYHFRTKQK
jgi:hypothetical protein